MMKSNGLIWVMVGGLLLCLCVSSVSAALVAEFSGTPTSGPAPLAVTFTDASAGSPSGWAWYFGDESYAQPWTQMNANAEWSVRSRSSVVAMPDGSIVLMGGSTSGGSVNDVWQSTDNGAHWNQVTAYAEWTARYGHSSVVMPDGSIVLMGGYATGGYKTDVWRSTDNGAHWTQMTPSVEWSIRDLDFSTVAMPDGSIILMGGYDVVSHAYMNDVWQSTDNGAHWNQVTAHAEWSARDGHTTVVMPDGSIVLMGGWNAGLLRDVWRSTDNGAHWTQMTASAEWSPRDHSTSVAMPDGSIVLMGGRDGLLRNDVWRSTDNGAHWTQITYSADWPGRWYHTSVAMPDGSIVLMGGSTSGGSVNDVWRLMPAGSSVPNPSHTYTTPGIYSVALQAYNAGGYNSVRKTGYITVTTPAPVADFTADVTSGAAPLPVSFTDNSLKSPTGWAWYFGDESYTQPWTLMNASAGWSVRYGHSSVAMPDGSIVLMGGSDNFGLKNDTWRSTDNGVTWTRVNASAGWSARFWHTSVIMPDGGIMLMGGSDSFGLKNDTWRSTDNGATWTRVNASSGWSARESPSSVAMPDGSIVLMGGWNSSYVIYKNDVWRSTDNGATWTQVNASAGWSARFGHTSVVMPDGSIVLMGGSDGGWKNDVWRSTDYGATWTRVNASSGWSGRVSHSSVAMPDGSIVLMGGNSAINIFKNDMWRSTDNGITWIQVSAFSGWTGRDAFSSVALPDGSIVLVGGYDVSHSRMNDVWRLTPAGSSAPNPSHTYTAPGTYQVALQAYNTGGYNSIRKTGYITVTTPAPVADFTANVTSGAAPLPVSFTDLSLKSPSGWAWYFGDESYAQPWTQMNASGGWTVRTEHSSVVMPDGTIVLTGGQVSGGLYTNDTWRSTDNGATWTLMNASSGWKARMMHTSVAMPDGSIVLMGGITFGARINDTWRSTDNGATWTLMNASSGWKKRDGPSSVAMPDGSIVLTGGSDGYIYYNDTWWSTDNGATWTLMNASSGWTGRATHSSVAMPDSSIVLTGGYEYNSIFYNDTWRSTDNGATWTLMNASSGWTTRNHHTSVAMPDGSIILMCGYPYTNDVWRSTDYGAMWTQLPDAVWSARWGHTSVAMPDGSIVLMGGGDGSSFKNDTWRLMPAGSSAPNPSHTYTAPGIYSVALQAYNAGGYNSTRKIGYITVTVPAPTPVTCPAVISSPGLYQLQNDCSNTPFTHPWTGINITSSNVEFDGMGHTIDGLSNPPMYTDVHDVYAGTGAALSNIIVKNVTVNGTWQAIYYNQVSNGRIEKIKGTNNGDSIFLLYSSHNTITDCTATNNGGDAFAIWPGSDYNTITNNVANNNNFGFALYDAQNNIVTDNVFENNNYGISVSGGSAINNQIHRNTIRKNIVWGILLDKAASGTPSSNSIYDNYFSNTANTFLVEPNILGNTWNMPPGTPGPNIIGGSSLGGNYWADPSGTGYSQTCLDADHNGICDNEYDIILGYDYDFFPLTTLTTPDFAATYVKNHLAPDLTGKLVYETKELALGDAVVHTIGDKSAHTMPHTPGHLVFIDDNMEANWEHPARLVHVEDKLENPTTTVYDVWSPVNDVEFSIKYGTPSDPAGTNTLTLTSLTTNSLKTNSLTTKSLTGGSGGGTPTLQAMAAAAACTPDCGHYYALLISGGIQKETNYARYWNDISFMFRTLNKTYGYPKSHITVLMSDGTGTGTDQLASYTADNTPNYADSKTDLDNDNIADVKDAATKTNVLNTLAALGSALKTDDNLFIFTTNHGGNTTDPTSKSVKLYLWGTDTEGKIGDAAFVNALPTGINSITIMMEQCFGGGFIDNFIDQYSGTQKRVIATAANWNEYSWGNAYSYAWISGESGNRLSMQEAHDYAKGKDPYATSQKETPQIAAKNQASTAQYLADCLATPSITVTAPGADTWYTQETRYINWKQAALSGKTVKIELWEGSATTKTMDITPSPVDATLETQSWYIPASLAPARDYYVKVYQTDAPGVFGNSAGLLTINRGNSADTGTLWINSTPVPNQGNVGAKISIDDVWQQDSTNAFIRTNATFTLSSGTHYVGLDRNQYYAVPASQVNVPLGQILPLNFVLEPVTTNDCEPYGTMDIRSSPVRDAKITIQGTTNSIPVQDILIKGLSTNTKTQIAPGTYTVTVEHDGYLTATRNGVTIAVPDCNDPYRKERATIVDFPLTKINDVTNAKVLVVPQPLNIGRPSSYFVAFVTLPSGYKAADVDDTKVYCEGARALKLFRNSKLFPQTFAAVFRRGDLDPGITAGTRTMHVEGVIKKTTGNVIFRGSTQVKVTNKKITTKEDIDDVLKWTLQQLFKFFK
jgi:uncharacterized delta-60 repeat protein